jgi:formate-dependent nitrite reductase membrane component NrfD
MFSLALLQDFPSDTFFTKSPDWTWLIIIYFFLGGIAGGSAFLGGLLDLWGAEVDRPIARIAHLLAAPLVAIGGILLVIDLNRPERFWHNMFESENGTPIFKWWSPISFGTWTLGAFGLFATIVFVGVLAEIGYLPKGLAALRQGGLGKTLSFLSGILGIFLCGYTGLLLTVTNRPFWGDTTLLGLLFLLSGVSAAAALLLLIANRRGHPASIEWLGRMDFWSSIIELAVVIVIAASINSVVRDVFDNWWGVLILVGFVLAGVLVPMVLHGWPQILGRSAIPIAAVLVIFGSFFLRCGVIMASERV